MSKKGGSWFSSKTGNVLATDIQSLRVKQMALLDKLFADDAKYKSFNNLVNLATKDNNNNEIQEYDRSTLRRLYFSNIILNKGGKGISIIDKINSMPATVYEFITNRDFFNSYLSTCSEFIITINYRVGNFKKMLGQLSTAFTNPKFIPSILAGMKDDTSDKCGVLGDGCLNPNEISILFLLFNEHLSNKGFKPRGQPQMSDEICQINYIRSKEKHLGGSIKRTKKLRR